MGVGSLRASLALVVAVVAAVAPSAQAAPITHKKAIWGPAFVDGRSQFPVYADLGVGVYQTHLQFDTTAPQRPQRPEDPADPAYRWPGELDATIAEASRHGIEVALQVLFAPRWANGGRSREWAPTDPRDFAAFVEAAARRYPSVRHWMIWGEPTRSDRFRPMARQRRPGSRLRGDERDGPRLYARLLDTAYGRLKRVSRRNLVIGGNTHTVGIMSPRSFIEAMKLPDGSAPRLDMYGHNPFTVRRPNLAAASLGRGYADFGSLDDLMRWIDRSRRGARRPPLFLSEFILPTDHANHEFNFHVTRRLAARWTTDAMRVVRRHPRLYTLGMFLFDDPPRPGGDEVNRGLLTHDGRRKPAYAAFRDG